MAFHLISLPRSSFLKLNILRNQNSHQCFSSTQVSHVKRPTSNYQPTIWSYDFVMSLKVNNVDSALKDKAEELQKKFGDLINNNVNYKPFEVLQLIDDVQRLGLGHRFEKEIDGALDKLKSMNRLNLALIKSVSAAALSFRLLRQHGYDVSEDVFRNLKPWANNDVKGLLSMYEASFLTFDGETELESAKPFIIKALKNVNEKVNFSLLEEVNHALELPRYYRTQRLEARWYIDAYRRRKSANRSLLELATLDFNMVQSVFQRDLQEASRWWHDVGLAGKLSFVRDRLVECFFWAAGIANEPQFSSCRVGLTKVSALITTIDDIYDVYGSQDELQLFTDVVKRWDVEGIKELPDYMKLCFLALYNTVNELAYDTLKKQGENTIPILAKAWADMCQAFMVEAKWNAKKHTPSLDVYLENGWISISGLVILLHAHFLMDQTITNKSLHSLEEYHELLRHSSLIFRLCNDLATSTAELERGESANSISCYMHETGISEESAREHVKDLLNQMWKSLNANRAANSPFDRPFIEAVINLARISHCTYQYGDGHGAPDIRSKNRILSLLIEPLALNGSTVFKINGKK